MAEGITVRSSDRVNFCLRYLMRSYCPRGINCPYKHSPESEVIIISKPGHNSDYVIGKYKCNEVPMPRRQVVPTHHICYYFLKGNCHYGSRCKFAHPVPIVKTSMAKDEPSTSQAVAEGSPEPKNGQKVKMKVPEEFVVRDTANCYDSIKNYTLNKDAPEFVPMGLPKTATSYACAVRNVTNGAELEANAMKKLCPYAEKDGYCKYPPGECTYLHGDICDLCGKAALHPHNHELSKKHTQECISQHERDMELSFAVARSKEKSCGVCFEVIMEKATGEQRFGILPNCNHCFCLSCIRKWRQARQFENKIIRACPECRVTSDFVCPSMYWVDTKEEKEKLIKNYKEALATKDCKYFRQGRGKCPFGNKCFYLHALPDGTKKDVGPPPRQRRNYCIGDLELLQRIILSDLSEDLEDLVALFSDSDESDWSDFELFLD